MHCMHAKDIGVLGGADEEQFIAETEPPLTQTGIPEEVKDFITWFPEHPANMLLKYVINCPPASIPPGPVVGKLTAA